MTRADSNYSTVPPYSLIRDLKLRRIFGQAGRHLGDEFAVPVAPQKGLDGGAAVSVELVEAYHAQDFHNAQPGHKAA